MPLSVSLFPIVRVSTQVHYREYEYSKRFQAVKDAIRKSVDETTPNIAFDRRPSFGVIDYVLDGGKDLDREIIAEADVVVLIIINSCFEFFFRFGME
jgi:hypothetical protein